MDDPEPGDVWGDPNNSLTWRRVEWSRGNGGVLSFSEFDRFARKISYEDWHRWVKSSGAVNISELGGGFLDWQRKIK